jgi:hypothetical protein
MAAQRSSVQVYRDCLRLVKHMAGGTSPKARMLRAVVREQFEASRRESRPDVLRSLRGNAERVLSQYLFYERSRTDVRFRKQLEEHLAREAPPAPAAPASTTPSAAASLRSSLAPLMGIDQGRVARYLEEEQAALDAMSPAQRAELAAALDDGDGDGDDGASLAVSTQSAAAATAPSRA